MTPTAPIADRRFPRLMFCAAALLCVAFTFRMAAAWKCYHHIDPTAGTWTAAAIDARDGTLYRPIESPLGYGGSRYAPLHIVLQAGLMRAGMGPVAAGYLLDLFGIMLVVAGLYALLRKLKVPPLTAAAFAPFVLAAYCYNTTAAGVKGDLIPAGLNLWGLAAIVAMKPGRSVSLLIIAALSFVLAIATKLTSVFGGLTAIIWFLSQKDARNAVMLAAIWLIGIAIAVALTQWASDGRALHIFRLCAAGGGGLRALVHGPHRMISDAIHNDRVFVCFWLLAAILIAMRGSWLSIPTILFVITTLGTIAIYGSPGTNCNHLVDLQAAAVLVIATNFTAGRDLAYGAAVAATAIVFISAINSGVKAVSILHENRHGKMLAALADANQSTVAGPLLAENPILPILQGERPYMLDSFMFRVIWWQDSAITAGFWSDLSNRRFRAVILSSSPGDPTRSDGSFGPLFVELLQKNYDLKGVHGDLWVYLPKNP